MLVYGDPKFETRLDVLHAQVCGLARRSEARPHDLDRLRSLLIACGQVEQSSHDALERALAPAEAAPLITVFHQATAHAAAAFYSVAYRQPTPLPLPGVDTPAALRHLVECLESLTDLPPIPVTVKLPEGFSFHAMYPEQYAVAAGQWLADHEGQRTQGAVVVGIRSIGTTLAAVVATVLRAAGWQVHSLTVRPNGHPYARQVDLGDSSFDSAMPVLVVDEGPGISGSSMAATAMALVRAGIRAQNIVFLPGHANEPGGAGSPEVQTWWRAVPRYVAGHDVLTFNGLPLQQALAATLPEPVTQIENMSGGVWRQVVYPDASAWPAVCAHFERVKYRFTLQSGKQVLFKFLGLATQSAELTTTAAAAADLLRSRAERGLALPPLAASLGFVATPWIAGMPMAPGTPSPDMVAALGAYVACVAGPPLRGAEFRVATDRLTEMLYVNANEALGETAAAKARRARPSAQCPQLAYGDGRLQPYEWINVGADLPLKVDSVGHDCDHTLVGKQPIAWDVAGAIVEWQLDPQAIACLLHAFHAAGGPLIDGDTLHFYRLAYLAFRAGQCSLAAQMHDPYENERLQAAYLAYRQQLAALLEAAGP